MTIFSHSKLTGLSITIISTNRNEGAHMKLGTSKKCGISKKLGH